jgi:hypothetical protein
VSGTLTASLTLGEPREICYRERTGACTATCDAACQADPSEDAEGGKAGGGEGKEGKGTGDEGQGLTARMR